MLDSEKKKYPPLAMIPKSRKKIRIFSFRLVLIMRIALPF